MAMNFCESDMHYRETCLKEMVFDIKEPEPTHGFFATHLHDRIWPQIILRDFGIGSIAKYVGYVDSQWWTARDTKLENQSIPIGEALPPKILFCANFFGYLSQYMHPLEREPRTIGNLKWYMVVQEDEIGTHEYFINCTMQGHKFSWHLPHNHEESCENGCHRIGLWRD